MRVNRLNRLSLGVAAGVVAGLAVGACGTSAPAASAPKNGGQLTHLTVGALPIGDDAPLFIAIKEGYFKQEGLTVTTKIVQQSTLAIPDMLNGSIDVVAGGNYVSFLGAQAKGVLKIRILAAASQCGSGANLNVLALPKEKITSPADLAGKTIAVNLTNNIQTLTTNAVLKADGVNAAKVKYVEIPFPDMVPALKAGSVDAISAVEPFVTGAMQTDGAVSVLAECSGPTADFPLSGYYATQGWVQQNPKTALAFQAAIDKAQALADSDHKLVQEILPTYTQITPKIASLMSLPDYPASLDATQIQRVGNLMLSGGMLTRPLNVTPLLFHPSGS